MTPSERVGALIAGTPVDRPPFALTASLYGARLTGRKASEYFSDPALYAAGQRAVAGLCGPDILFGPFAFALEAAAFGAEAERFDDAPPLVRKPATRSPAGIGSIRRPDPGASAELRCLVDSLAAVVADQGGQRPVAAPIAAPTDLPILLMGMEGWVETLLFEPELAAEWAALAADHFAALASAYFAAGASFVVVPVMSTSPAIMAPNLIERLLMPILREAFGRLAGPIVFHHGGNRLSGLLPMLKDLPNVAGFVLDERDSFAEARQALGPGHLLLGNLSGPQCGLRPAADLEARTRALLADRRTDAKFIFATSGADIPYDTDPRVLERLGSLLGSAP